MVLSIIEEISLIKLMKNFIIRKMIFKDISHVVEIHKSELRNSYLNLFGDQFLINIYKLLSRDNQVFVICDNKKIAGFIALNNKKIQLYKCLTLNAMFIFFINFIKNPLLLVNFIIFYYKSMTMNSFDKSFSNIFQFAISREFQSNGLGDKLLKYVNLDSKKNKFLKMCTLTHNYRLVCYYMERFNAKIKVTFKVSSTNFYVIVWDLL